VSKSVIPILLLSVGMASGQTKPSHGPTQKPETPHLRFVKEFVRELIEDESRKANGEKELREAKTPNEQFSAGIYFSKSTQLELRSQIAMLKSMRLKDPFDTLIPSLIDSYQHEIDLHQKLIDISGKFMAVVPKEGVDYEALAAKMPEVRAELDATRKTLFDAAPLVFMSMVDMKPDSQGHASRLLITKAEKADLETQLEILLKDIPEKGDQDYYISAAMILRGGLQKEYKCSDEPWE
jgi:hypothetical protein